MEVQPRMVKIMMRGVYEHTINQHLLRWFLSYFSLVEHGEDDLNSYVEGVEAPQQWSTLERFALPGIFSTVIPLGCLPREFSFDHHHQQQHHQQQQHHHHHQHGNDSHIFLRKYWTEIADVGCGNTTLRRSDPLNISISAVTLSDQRKPCLLASNIAVSGFDFPETTPLLAIWSYMIYMYN